MPGLIGSGVSGRALLVLGAVLVCLLLVSCGQGPAPDNLIRFVTWKPNHPQAWQTVLDLFAREHPELKVVREIGPHSSTAFHDLLTQKLKNKSTEVDVFLMDVIWPPEFASAGWAQPLDDLLPPSEQAEFLPGAIQAGTYRGRIFGIPLNVDAGLLYYRLDLLAKYNFKVPRTWEELANQARTIIEAESGAGKQLAGYSGQFKQYEGLVCDMLEFMLSNQGSVLGPEGLKCRLTQSAALEAVGFVRDRIIGHIAPRGVLTYQEPESLALFIQGGSVFMRNWPYAFNAAQDPERSRVVGKVGVAPLPHFPGGKSSSTLGGWQVGVSAFSRNTQAAGTFAKFLTSARVQKIFSVSAGRAPTRLALYDDPEVIRANPQFADMSHAFKNARPRPRSPLYPAISDVLQRYFHTAIIEPGSDIPALAHKACAEINQLTALTAGD